MTITNTKRLKVFIGNSSATEFDYDFYIPDADSLVVSLYNTTTGVLTVVDSSDYSVTGLGSESFGAVTYPLVGSPITSTYWLIVKRAVPNEQNLDMTNQSSLFPTDIETQLDLIVMMIQQLTEEGNRALKLTEGDAFDNYIPDQTLIASRALAFDANGEPTIGPLVTDISSASTYASNAAASAAAAAASAATVEDEKLVWQGAWVTATAYDVNDAVENGGSSYICLVAHTSGTFATDLAASKWELLAQKGADGAGSGDMTAAVYDPGSVADDAFDMDNMVEGTDTKIMTAAERTKVGYLTVTGAADLDTIVAGTLYKNVENQTLTGGAVVTEKDLGTKSSGTLTMDVGDRPLQKVTNGGAFTLAPGTNIGSTVLSVTNNASAGTITTSGFTKVTGSFTTTNGHKFQCSIVVSAVGSSLQILAMQ